MRGTPTPGRGISACSDRYRAAKTRWDRGPLSRAEAQAIRARLTTALAAVWEAKATVEQYRKG